MIIDRFGRWLLAIAVFGFIVAILAGWLIFP